MAFVPGFRLGKRIYESEKSLVVKAVRDADGLPVVLKVLRNEFPSLTELARYQREFEILNALETAGVVKAYDLLRQDKSLILVLEDFGGFSVAELLKQRPVSIDEFFDIATQLTGALAEIHDAKIVHKDINPHNVIINPSTGEVKITDFGIATRFTRETPMLGSPDVLEGTLHYLSPEQTGRMNRTLDSRSDLYSLGATFYEMLTRATPFDAQDKLELVHCHIAREPIPAHRRNAEIPLALSKIVSKLMAKKAEDRYQSAVGMLADLESLRDGATPDRFEPGLKDQSRLFQIPERLYGRDNEVARLLETFERVRKGPAELMLVSGYSGVGKSALVRETHKPITRARGYFLSGKFDQFQRHTPYSGLMTALRDLLRQILTESAQSVAAWRAEIDAALTPNAQVVVDVLPELELVIGPQPPAQELKGAEARNRFQRLIARLLKALSGHDRPVVMFLDDLQWADTATLNLLRFVFTEGDVERFLLVGAYRDNEVDALHPLTNTRKEIEQEGGRVGSLSLGPLRLPDVAQLLSDTLKLDAAELMPLARLVLQKTQGNPLFVRQFLLDLHREGLISHAAPSPFERARWSWNLPAIRAAGITDNVVDLLLRRLRMLPDETQRALQIAACIGARFDLDTLALVLEIERAEAFDDLRVAVEEELIRPASEMTAEGDDAATATLLVRDFAFQHDRVQQAAYSLMDEHARRAQHLTIGRTLQAQFSGAALEERVFDIVDHLNAGRALITDAAELLEVARLNLTAARKASDATAYAAALTLVRIAHEVLGEQGWRETYELTRDVHRLRAELEYLNGNFDICSQIVAATIENVRTDLERAEVYFTRIAQHTLLAQFTEAVDAGCRALSLLGVEMPRDDLEQEGQRIIGEVAAMLQGVEPSTLLDAPDVNSAEIALAQRSLRPLTIAAFLSNQDLWPVVVGTSVKLSLEHGLAPESALSFANYGLILGAFMGRYQDGAAFGRLALKLCDRFDGRAPNATVRLVVGAELLPWVGHVRESLPVIDRGVQEGLDAGDILWVGYLAVYRVLLEAFGGARLETLLEQIPERLEFAERTGNQGAVAAIRAHQIVLAGLAGREEIDAVAEAAPTEAEEAAFVEMCRERRLSLGFCLYKALKAQALYVMGRPAEALEATLEIEDKLNFIVNHPTLADHRLYQSLAMTALYPSGDAERDARTLDALDANLRRLDAWAESGPQNFLAKRFMVAAEIARIRGEDAADLYDRAIEAAHENELPQDEAVANELAARFVMETRPRSRIAAMYMRDAHYAYRLWGAERKVEELELEFPELVAHYRDMREGTLTSIEARKTRKAPNTAEMRLVEFDVETLLKAAETISGEFVLSRLLDRLLGILIENVGAQRGVLALARDGALFVEAAADLTSTSSEVMMSIPLDAPEAAALAPVGVLNFVARTGEVVVMDDALSDERFVGEPYIAQRETRSVLCQPLHNQGALIGLIYLENDLIPSAFSPERAHLVSLLSGQIAISIRNAELVETLEEKVRERTDQLEVHSRFIEQTFGRYLSSQVVDRLLKSPDGLDFRGHNQVVTIMSTDLRGFSTFADTLPPETIVTLLNNYLSEMTQVVEQYNGTIDAFIGDSILTVFGVPFQRPDDAERAVACALQMQLAMKKVNAWNAKQGLPELEMGIGIATGEAVVGNIGSRKRAKFGAVGRNVNLAVRVEGYTVGGQVLITEGARDAVQCEMRLRDAGAVEPKGFLRPVPLFEVLELGGKHALAAPRHEFDWTALTRPEPVAFRLVTDKKVMGALIEGVVTQLCQSGARIVSDTPPPVSTDLQLELKARDGSLRAGGICGKIVPGGDAEGGFVLRFTAMPPEARAALAVLLDDGAPAREAVDSAH